MRSITCRQFALRSPRSLRELKRDYNLYLQGDLSKFIAISPLEMQMHIAL